jgi:hypothetical protein
VSTDPSRDARARKEQLRLRRVLQQRQTADFYYLIDVVGTCNLRCPSCPVGNYPDASPKGLMSIGKYEAILEKIAREHPGERVFVDLFNWGEPGLHKHLGEIIRRTRARGFGVGISTNLNVFPDMKDAVMAAPSYIRISLSGYFNETYQQTHKRGDINVVKANMHLLRSWIDRLQSDTIVEVGFHIYRSNFPEDFRRMRQLCHDLGFIFAPVVATLMPVEKAVQAVDFGTVPGEETILRNLVVSIKERAALLAGARDRYPDCQFRRKRTTINFDGSVPLCCATYEQSQIIAVDFLTESRQALQARKYEHPFCMTCQTRSLDMVYTAVDPHLVDAAAVRVLGPEFQQFLDEWNVSLEPLVEWEGQELSPQDAFEVAAMYESVDCDRAEKVYSRIVEQFPRHGEALFRLGRLEESRGNRGEAVSFYRAARDVWPTHPPYADAVARLERARPDEETD